MKYLIIPLVLSAILISGCASAGHSGTEAVKVIPQQAESQAQPAQTEVKQLEPAQPAASEIKPTPNEVIPEPKAETDTGTAELKEGESIHIVDIFESLWSIAQKEYGDGNKWELIYEANKDQIENPKVIFPKQELVIPQE